MAKFDSFQESPLGAFMESPLHARLGGTLPAIMTIFGGDHLSVGTLQNTEEYDKDKDVWTSLTDMLSKKRDLAGATLENTHYISGGYFPLHPVRDMEAFYNNTWTEKADMPLPARRLHASTDIAGKAYAFAGSGDPGIDPKWLQDNDEYTPDVWVAKADVPVPARQGAAASTAEGKAYLTGGGIAPADNEIRDNDEYDPNAWVARTDMVYPKRRQHSSTVFDGQVYCFGGSTEAHFGDMRSNDKYDPGSDSWTKETDIPWPHRASAAASSDSKASYYVGGQSQDGVRLRGVDRYMDSTWSERQELLYPGREELASSTP